MHFIIINPFGTEMMGGIEEDPVTLDQRWERGDRPVVKLNSPRVIVWQSVPVPNEPGKTGVNLLFQHFPNKPDAWFLRWEQVAYWYPADEKIAQAYQQSISPLMLPQRPGVIVPMKGQ